MEKANEVERALLAIGREASIAEIGFLKSQIDEIKEELKELRKENKEILRFVHEAQGGKKYLAFILTTAVGLGVLIDQLIRYIRV